MAWYVMVWYGTVWYRCMYACMHACMRMHVCHVCNVYTYIHTHNVLHGVQVNFATMFGLATVLTEQGLRLMVCGMWCMGNLTSQGSHVSLYILHVFFVENCGDLRTVSQGKIMIPT